jgi:hypothetical protein
VQKRLSLMGMNMLCVGGQNKIAPHHNPKYAKTTTFPICQA